MRWWAVILMIACGLTLQASVAPRMVALGARPDWLLVLVVFVGLHGRRREAIIAAWAIGMCADLMSIERVGLMALSYTIVAWFVGSIRDYLFRHQVLTQCAVTVLAAVLIQSAWFAYRRSVYTLADPWTADLARTMLIAPLYTAIWSPPVHFALLSVAPLLGLPRPRYSFAGTQTTGMSRV